MEYVVAIKRSARRRSAAAGELVARRGSRRTFASKALAQRWARELESPGAESGSLWIQDAAPNDPADVDGYLVAADPRRGEERRSGEDGEQQTRLQTD